MAATAALLLAISVGAVIYRNLASDRALTSCSFPHPEKPSETTSVELEGSLPWRLTCVYLDAEGRVLARRPPP